jgi:hypothetical protein
MIMIAAGMTMIAGLTGSLAAISAHRARRKRVTAEALVCFRAHGGVLCRSPLEELMRNLQEVMSGA